MIKKGKTLVRTGFTGTSYSKETEIGLIFKTTRKSRTKWACLNSREIAPNDFRKASKREIAAFELLDIDNINQIPKNFRIPKKVVVEFPNNPEMDYICNIYANNIYYSKKRVYLNQKIYNSNHPLTILKGQNVKFRYPTKQEEDWFNKCLSTDEYIPKWFKNNTNKNTNPFKEINDLKGKTVFHCEDEKTANRLLKLAHSFGYKWCNGYSFLEANYYNKYKKATCYDIIDGVYADSLYFLDANIKNAKDFLDNYFKNYFNNNQNLIENVERKQLHQETEKYRETKGSKIKFFEQPCKAARARRLVGSRGTNSVRRKSIKRGSVSYNRILID